MLPEVIAFEGPRLLTRDAGSRLRTRLDSGGRAPSWEELLFGTGSCSSSSRLRSARRSRSACSTPGPNGWRSCRRAFQAMTGDARRSATPSRDLAALSRSASSTRRRTMATSSSRRTTTFAYSTGPRQLSRIRSVGTVLPLRFAVERTESSPERLRDTYLEPFISLAPLTELQESFSHGYLLGALVRALTWAALDVPREVSAELGDPVPAWLEIFDGIAAGIITLGRHDARSGDESRSRPLRKAWELQRAVAAEVADGARPDTILLLEHPPTVTTGRRTEESELHIPAGAVVDVVETEPRRQVDLPRAGPARLLPDLRPDAPRPGRQALLPRARGGADPDAGEARSRRRADRRPHRGLADATAAEDRQRSGSTSRSG